MTDKQRYEASKQFAYHPCRIVFIREDGSAGNMTYFKSREACLADCEKLDAAGVTNYQPEL